MVWRARRWCYPHVTAFSVSRSEPNGAFMGYSGMTPETAFSTSIKQVWVDCLSRGRMVPHPSCRITDAGGLYATAHTGRTGCTWWPNALLSDFTLAFPFLSTTCTAWLRWNLSENNLKIFKNRKNINISNYLKNKDDYTGLHLKYFFQRSRFS